MFLAEVWWLLLLSSRITYDYLKKMLFNTPCPQVQAEDEETIMLIIIVAVVCVDHV